MIRQQDIIALAIRLAAPDRTLFHFLVNRDGAIQRQGSARLRDPIAALHVGVTREPIFQHLVDELPAEILEQPGSYEIPGGGTRLVLTIDLWTETASQHMAIAYGATGEGPPGEIVRFVVRAREWSEGWYRQVLEPATGAASPK